MGRAAVFLSFNGMTLGHPLYWSTRIRKSRPLTEVEYPCGSARMGVLLLYAVEAAHGEAKADVQCNICMTELLGPEESGGDMTPG